MKENLGETILVVWDEIDDRITEIIGWGLKKHMGSRVETGFR
jgi:hypothetical protein